MTPIHLGGFIIASAVAMLYNFGVDRYASYRIKQMASIPLEPPSKSNADETNYARSTTELLRSVSRRTGLVERTEDRRAWNLWLLISKGRNAPIVPEPGEYTFMYRSNVKFDEGSAIRKALWHLPTLLRGFVNTKRGVLVVQIDGKSATITDHYRKGLNPIVIEWKGKIDASPSEPKIVWTGTSMTVGRGKARKVIVNPPMAEKLRKVPWKIVKMEDGIVAFQNADGYLVYANHPDR